jgi:2-polyprenyl-3-methyl-5-hydroxy-6-metoxy-1,4-benzoquinol methylase
LKKHRLDFHAKIGYGNRVALLKKIGLQKDSRILDYGCGNGLFVQYLQSKGYTNATGYDPYIEAYTKTSLLHRSYDVVTSYDVIEHVEDPKSYMQDLVSLVKPGGLLVVGTPNAEEIDLFDPEGPAVELSQPYHRHILSARALFRLAEDNNLEVVDVYRRFYFDSLLPMVNTRCMWTYIKATGGMIDAAVEPIRWSQFLKSPRLLLYAFIGYFLPPRGNILLSFRVKPVAESS